MSNVQYVGKHMDLEGVAEIRNVKGLTLANEATEAAHAVRKQEFDVEIQQLNAEAVAKAAEAKNYTDAVKAEIIGGAGDAMNTFKELEDYLATHENAADAIKAQGEANATAIASKVSNEVVEDVTFTNASGLYTAVVNHNFGTSHVTARLRYLSDLKWLDLDDDGVTMTYSDTQLTLQTLSPTIGAMTLAAIISGVIVA